MIQCKDCGCDVVRTGKNHKRCLSCKATHEKEMNRIYDRKVWYKQYGITLEEYNKRFEEQQGCCAICNSHQLTFNKKLAVDHCHETGVVRGLLCMNCNLLLGYAKDNIDLLSKAIKYLDIK